MPAGNIAQELDARWNEQSPWGLFLTVLVEVSEYSLDLSDYRDIMRDNRIHVVVLRLQPDVVFFLVESLYRSACLIVIIYQSYHDFAV